MQEMPIRQVHAHRTCCFASVLSKSGLNLGPGRRCCRPPALGASLRSPCSWAHFLLKGLLALLALVLALDFPRCILASAIQTILVPIVAAGSQWEVLLAALVVASEPTSSKSGSFSLDPFLALFAGNGHFWQGEHGRFEVRACRLCCTALGACERLLVLGALQASFALLPYLRQRKADSILLHPQSAQTCLDMSL